MYLLLLYSIGWLKYSTSTAVRKTETAGDEGNPLFCCEVVFSTLSLQINSSSSSWCDVTGCTVQEMTDRCLSCSSDTRHQGRNGGTSRCEAAVEHNVRSGCAPSSSLFHFVTQLLKRLCHPWLPFTSFLWPLASFPPRWWLVNMYYHRASEKIALVIKNKDSGGEKSPVNISSWVVFFCQIGKNSKPLFLNGICFQESWVAINMAQQGLSSSIYIGPYTSDVHILCVWGFPERMMSGERMIGRVEFLRKISCCVQVYGGGGRNSCRLNKHYASRCI